MIRIDILPDDVLVEIFHFYVDMSRWYFFKRGTEAWQSLLHVCRRWRNVVFQSPRRLNLRLYCTPETPAMDTLDVWPALPLIVQGDMTLSGTENVIAALGQSNRVCQVDLHVAGWQLKKVLAAMQVPFPELTDLGFSSNDKTVPVIPDSDSFLDGCAPRLQHFSSNGVPFPGWPKSLLSATHLAYLRLSNIPHSGYISPEAMVALLSVLSCLRALYLEFEYPQSRPDSESRCLPPLQRSILPALDKLYFRGVAEYLEDLVTSIDAPQLEALKITLFNQIDFDTPRLAQFINRTRTFEKGGAEMTFDYRSVNLNIGLKNMTGDVEINILRQKEGWQLSSIEQVCNSSLHLVSTLEYLRIKHYSWRVWKNDAIENALLWLELLPPFTAVKNLYLSEGLEQGIAAALQELVGGRLTEVLPSLQNIFVEGPRHRDSSRITLGSSCAVRQLSNHPIAISARRKSLRA
jgi:hypothetical protein